MNERRKLRGPRLGVRPGTMNYPGRESPRSPERNGRGGGAWELGADAGPAFGGGGVCCFEHLPGGDPGDGGVSLALLRGEPRLRLAPGADDLPHLALDPSLSDENYFSSAESGSSLRYYSEGESGGGGSSSSLHPPPSPALLPTNSGGGGAAGAGPGERKRARPGGPAARHRYEVVTELGPEEVRWFYREDKKTWKPFIGYDSLRIELAFRTLLQAPGARARDGDLACGPAAPERSASGSGEEEDDDDRDRACGFCPRAAGREPETEGLVHIEPVCVRGGLYEVDVTQGECYPVYWNRKWLAEVGRAGDLAAETGRVRPGAWSAGAAEGAWRAGRWSGKEQSAEPRLPGVGRRRSAGMAPLAEQSAAAIPGGDPGSDPQSERDLIWSPVP